MPWHDTYIDIICKSSSVFLLIECICKNITMIYVIMSQNELL